MSDPIQDNRPPITLAERFDRYQTDVEQIVSRGIEHPRYELKRSATISRDALSERLDFVKLIQGVANAHGEEERFIVIGADQRERKFYNVENVAEFDSAKLSQIIAKYLEPVPRFEVFNYVRPGTGESYVLIAFDPQQPRPIAVVTEGQFEQKVHFRVGDIWIKKDTSLQLTTRADLDAIYDRYIARKVDEEAENRARRRFEHFREEFAPVLTSKSASPAPSPELLVGMKKHLFSFAEETIATQDITRFKMLLEMARDRLIEKRELRQVGNRAQYPNLDIWEGELAEFYRDEFVPSLDSIIDLGLQIIKYEGPAEWLRLIVGMLCESFALQPFFERLNSMPNAANSTAVAAIARSSYEVYIGARTLATYAIKRRRYTFLKEILPRFVHGLTPNGLSLALVPILFWPFSGDLGLPDMRQGRNQTLWNEHVERAWGGYFGSVENFLAAASELEFVLEFNSYVFEGIQDTEVKKLKQEFGNKYFAYLPDFWTSRLDPILPMAERFYDSLAASPDFPPEFAIEKKAIDVVLKAKESQDRLLFFGKFLACLRSWQATAMMQENRFPFSFQWPERLKVIVDAFVESKKVG